jgi:pimeloyl-ACP methyl ester carboxylesterase
MLREGDGPPVLLLHPIGHCADVFIRNIDGLARRHTVVAPDLPGHGFAEPIDFADRSPQAATCDYLLSLMTALGFERFSVLGSSYGGLVATLLALNHPERIAQLGIIGSASTFSVDKNQEVTLRAVMANAATAMCSPSFESCRKRLQNICFYQDRVPEELVALQATCYAQPDRYPAFVATIEALIGSARAGRERVQDRLESLSLPVQVIVGRNDMRADWRLHESGSKRIPNSTCHVIEECGHLPYMEHPAAFNSMSLNFLHHGI